MPEFNVFSYAVPALLLLIAVVPAAKRPAQNAPILVLLLLWVFVFSAHGIVAAFQIVPLFPTDIFPNLLITLAVLTIALSFMFWRNVFCRTMGTHNARIEILSELDGEQGIPRWIQWTITVFAFLAFALMNWKAAQISGTSNVLGSMQFLRTQLNYEGASWGLVGYLGLPVTVLAVYMVAISKGQQFNARLPSFLIVLFALGIAVLSTQRTSIFMLLIGLTFATSRRGLPNLRTLSILAAILITAFFSIGFLVGKVGQEGVKIGEVLLLGVDSFLLYFFTPLSAFGSSEIWNNAANTGDFSFRFFLSVLQRLGLYSGEIQELVMEFIWVPLPTNVYTFAFVSIYDFGPFFMMYHFLIGTGLGFVFALPRRKISIRVLQGFSYYALLMTLFQDQFATITSTWIQVLIVLVICDLLTSSRKGAFAPMFDHNNASPEIDK